MAFAEPITKTDSYKKYLQEIGVKPNKKLENIFSSGLPAVWLYLKAIGLEELYFDLLKRIENNYQYFKEIFYLLLLANGKSPFFPTIGKNFLKFKIPPEVAAAEVQLAEPAFRMAFGFTRDQLIEVLTAITKPNYMVRIGNQKLSVGIMYSNDAYHVYHTGNPSALEYNNIDSCVDVIMRVLG